MRDFADPHTGHVNMLTSTVFTPWVLIIAL
jgi:hypothetical protein